MNSKVKVGIAAVILCALIGLILLDQKTAPRDTQAPAETVTAIDKDAELFNLVAKAREQYDTGNGTPIVAPPPSLKQDPPGTGKEIAPVPAPSQDYVIQPNDTYASLAEKFYGDRNLWSTIAQANPTVKPMAMRPGKTISIPSRPERSGSAVAQMGGTQVAAPRTYIVQSGDTLEGISKKIYNSPKYTQKIFEANRAVLKDAGTLNVGMTLTLPEPPAQPAAAEPGNLGAVTTAGMAPLIDIAGPAPVADDSMAAPGALAGAKRVHAVQSGESLWKIADKYRGDRGIMDTIKAIVQANPDKLANDTTSLRVGWELTIPE